METNDTNTNEVIKLNKKKHPLVLIEGGGESYRVFEDESSIILFSPLGGQIIGEEEEAVKSSFSYAQLKEDDNGHNRLLEEDDWCNGFIKNMKILGWTFEKDLTFEDYKGCKDSFTLKEFILSYNLSELEKGLIIILFEALKNMDKENKRILDNFIGLCTNSNNANIRFGICHKDNNEIKLKLFVFYIHTTEEIKNIFTDTFNSAGADNVFKLASEITSFDLSTYNKNIEDFKNMFSTEVESHVEEFHKLFV